MIHEFLSNYGWEVWLFVGSVMSGISWGVDPDNDARFDPTEPFDWIFLVIFVVLWPITLGELIGTFFKWIGKTRTPREDPNRPGYIDGISTEDLDQMEYGDPNLRKPDPIDHFSGHGGG